MEVLARFAGEGLVSRVYFCASFVLGFPLALAWSRVAITVELSELRISAGLGVVRNRNRREDARREVRRKPNEHTVQVSYGLGEAVKNS